jgi:hypothetical protein
MTTSQHSSSLLSLTDIVSIVHAGPIPGAVTLSPARACWRLRARSRIRRDYAHYAFSQVIDLHSQHSVSPGDTVATSFPGSIAVGILKESNIPTGGKESFKMVYSQIGSSVALVPGAGAVRRIIPPFTGLCLESLHRRATLTLPLHHRHNGSFQFKFGKKKRAS